jgi:hypothetical protein
MRFVGTDELGNDWSWSDKNAPNVKRKERAFSHFDFALMTRAEIDFLWKLANGFYPYPESSTKQYGISGGVGRGYAKYSDVYVSYLKSNSKRLQAFLNWAPLNEEIEQISVSITGAGIESGVTLDSEEFILSFYAKNGGPDGSFNTSADGLIIGNLDQFIKSGIDPYLPKDHPFYGKIIPPRELVFYIRRKYGIGAAYDQTYDGSGTPQFKTYKSEFLFTEEYSISDRLESKFALNRIRNPFINPTILNIAGNPTKYPIRGKDVGGGQSLSEQAFLIKSQQYNLYKDGILMQDSSVKSLANNLLSKSYDSLNTQKLHAHWRACKMVDELNKWAEVIQRGVKNGDIIPVVSEITKRGSESKILSEDEHKLMDQFTTVNVLAAKSSKESPTFGLQYISNIPYDVEQKKHIQDYEYHKRSWNERGGYDGVSPLFIRPELSSDYVTSECDLEKSTYFMRNLILPHIEKYVSPAYYSEESDKDDASYFLTLIELQKRLTKEYPLVQNGLTNKDYDTLKSLTINVNSNKNFEKIIQNSDQSFDVESKRIIDEYLKKSGLDAKIYKLKKNLNASILATIAGLSLVHEVAHGIEHHGMHYKPNYFMKLFSQAIGVDYTDTSKILHSAHLYGHAAHIIEGFIEVPAVALKIASAIAQVSMYGDTASYIALTKEVVLGGLGIESALFGGTVPRILGISGFAWTLIIIGVSLWVDQIVSNVRQDYKQDKFRKLLKEAHDAGYIEGVYAETGGTIRIKKEDVYNIRLRRDEQISNSEAAADEPAFGPPIVSSNYVQSNEELMDAKGKRFFWDRIAKNPIECQTILEIAKKQRDGQRYNPILNSAPNTSDYGVFTENAIHAIGGIKRNFAVPGGSQTSIGDRYYPYIHARFLAASGVKPQFKYSRMSIGIDTDLTSFFNGTREPSEFLVNSVGFKSSKSSEKISDKEKIWLIRKKYGLDLINTDAGENCCNAKLMTNDISIPEPITNRIKDGYVNKRLSVNKFLTGKPTQGKDLSTGKQLFDVGCEYVVDLASPEVISKLEQICSAKKEIPKNDATRNKKISQAISPKTNLPVPTYTPSIDEYVTNRINLNYIDETGKSAKRMFDEKGGESSGQRDVLPSDSPLPRFARKADVTELGIQTGPISTNSISRFLAEFATMDIRSDIRFAINTLASYWATSTSSDPIDQKGSGEIHKGSLNTPLLPNIRLETPSYRTEPGRSGTPSNIPENNAVRIT